MSEFLSGSSLFAILLTFGAYELGRMFQQKTRMAIFNPILVGALLAGVVLVLTGVSNEAYQEGCATFSWLLTPATVCLAIPLYAQFSRLRHNLPAILAGVTAGTLTSLGFVWLLTRLCGLNEVLTVSLMPKSITTAMGIVVSEAAGGEPAITTAAIILTGILGSILGPACARLCGCGIRWPRAWPLVRRPTWWAPPRRPKSARPPRRSAVCLWCLQAS